MGTVSWSYSDWRSQATTALQLTRLRLHLQEVENYALESASRGRSLKLSDNLLPTLQAELERLERKIALAAVVGRFGVSSFERGSGP